MPVTGNLQQIRDKVRRLTGRPSTNQLSDAELDDYINDFYQYDLPQHLKLWNLKNAESPLLPTTPSGDRIITEGRWLYALDWNKFVNVEPPCYVNGYQIQYFQDMQSFLQYFPLYEVSQTLTVGTGIAGPYNGTITNIPILPQSMMITVLDGAGNTLVADCTAAGVITGDVLPGGTINFTTGVVAGLTWTAAIPVGNEMTATTLRFVTGRPRAVLFYNQVFVFYPVPDMAYTFFATVYYSPDELLVGDEPEIRQWWNLIALGAALKIFADNLDMDSYGKVNILFDTQKRLVERRTLKQLSTQRVATIYGDSSGWPSGSYGYPYS